MITGKTRLVFSVQYQWRTLGQFGEPHFVVQANLITGIELLSTGSHWLTS